MTFAEFKKGVIRLAFPAGESPHTRAAHEQSIKDGLAFLQEHVRCLRRVNVDIVPHCATHYKCGTTAFPFSNGRIREVGVVSERKRQAQSQPSTFETGAVLNAASVDMTHLSVMPARPIGKVGYEYLVGVQLDLSYIVPDAYPGTRGSILVQGAIYYKSKQDLQNVYQIPGTQALAARQEFRAEVSVNDFKRIEIEIEPASHSTIWAEIYNVELASGVLYPDARYSIGYAIFGPPNSRSTNILTYDAEWCGYIKYRFVHPEIFKRWYQAATQDPELKKVDCCRLFNLPEEYARKARHIPQALRPSPPYPYGYVMADPAYDSPAGRAYAGVWTIMDGMIHVAPWIQSYEAVVVHWDGVKKDWADNDVVANDPILLKAIVAYTLKDHCSFYDKNDVLAQQHEMEFEDALRTIYYNCVQESIQVSDRYRSSVLDGVASIFGMESLETRQSGDDGGESQLYGNDELRRTFTCQDINKVGDGQVDITVPANTFVRPTKALANQDALNYARQLAAERLTDCRDTYGWTNSNRYQATARCPTIHGSPSPTGEPKTGVVEVGEVVSLISQDDANAIAQQLARERAFQQLQCTYHSAAIQATRTCQANPSITASVNIEAGRYKQTVQGIDNSDTNIIQQVQGNLNQQAANDANDELNNQLWDRGCADGLEIAARATATHVIRESITRICKWYIHGQLWSCGREFTYERQVYGTGRLTVFFLYGQGEEYDWHTRDEARTASERQDVRNTINDRAAQLAIETAQRRKSELPELSQDYIVPQCYQCPSGPMIERFYGDSSVVLRIKKLSELIPPPQS